MANTSETENVALEFGREATGVGLENLTSLNVHCFTLRCKRWRCVGLVLRKVFLDLFWVSVITSRLGLCLSANVTVCTHTAGLRNYASDS